METKAEDIEISSDDVEQAISYARHPRVAGTYAAILNGRRFIVYRTALASTEAPIIDLEVASPEALAAAMAGLLSPLSIKRDCRPPIVDIKTPLAPGLRSQAQLAGGYVQYRTSDWSANFAFPQATQNEMDESCRRMATYHSAITGGQIWRDSASRIRAKLSWTAPERSMLQFAIEKGLFEIEYVALHSVISTDPNSLTSFDAIGSVTVQKGEQIFDFRRWRSQVTVVDSEILFQGRAVGAFDGVKFAGDFQSEMVCLSEAVPDLRLIFRNSGDFAVDVDVS